MEIDTGASVSIISEQSQKHIFPQAEVGVSQLQLETYTGEKLTVKGQMQVVVGYRSQEKNLVLHVVAGEGPTLMGRDWLKHIQLDWQTIGKIQAQHPIGNLQEILNRYAEIFADALGTIEQFRDSLQVSAGATQLSRKRNTVLFAIKEAVEAKFECLESVGIL